MLVFADPHAALRSLRYLPAVLTAFPVLSTLAVLSARCVTSVYQRCAKPLVCAMLLPTDTVLLITRSTDANEYTDLARSAELVAADEVRKNFNQATKKVERLQNELTNVHTKPLTCHALQRESFPS